MGSVRLRRAAPAALLLATFFSSAACDDSPTEPSGQAVATIRVNDETFRIRLTTPEQIAAAEAARDGGPANIPVGRIRPGTDVNSGWSWHLEDVTFAETAIELCDGVPSMVEREGPSFANGWFCPWGARVIDVRPL
ncbi:MAG TPA: hypothetical protein VIL35_02740 [Vicinamibacterales bacterium]